MNDQELLKKLNNLKSIRPDNNWQKEYRDILFSQISAGQPAEESKSNLRIVWEIIVPREILMNFAKPVWLASMASVLILIVGIGGIYASKNSKPGDSLYIAKIISERAQFTMTFDEKNKAKLGVEFAANRAKEMIQVLQDTGQTAAANDDKLEKLSQNFKQEISQVKNRLSIIKATKDQAKAQEADLEVFGANLGKNDQRMEISEPPRPLTPERSDGEPVKPTPAVEPAKTGAVDEISEKPAAAGSAGSPRPELGTKAQQAAATSSVANANPAGQMLDDAEKLVDEKSIDSANGAIDKLKEAKQIINQESENSGEGQVKGASETAASSTENAK